MASGYRSGGVDFDDLFEAGTSGTAVPSARSGGVPLRYAALGSSAKRPDVGYRYNGSDVSNLWLPKGAGVGSLPINGQNFSIGETVPNLATGSCAITFRANPDGTFAVTPVRSHGGNGAVTTGSWLPSGSSASDFQIQFEATAASGTAATITNEASAYQALTTARAITAALGPYGSSAGSRDSVTSITIRIKRVSSGSVGVTTVTFSLAVDGSA
ncbi:hypothetical protein [Xanthomonas sp. SI]|uniref:hypothetical protein n=1 Tax=Xanthomonas sp. SI TaxID=2724123 RepID=UPI00163B6052|nr:hypothetical protein [Xanthomonas sp. SI]QNH13095.1 hypothetical protein HEP75_02542 [Xanthomonas sp. SI]